MNARRLTITLILGLAAGVWWSWGDTASAHEDHEDHGLASYGETDRSQCAAGLKRVGTAEGVALCTHGADPRAEMSRLPTPEAGTGAELACVGNGRQGPRVHAIYARPADAPDRYASVRSTIVAHATAVDAVFSDSAAKTGGQRQVRWLTDAACNLVVDNVVLSAGGDDDFGATINELQDLGYDRTTRKYLIWMDSTGNGICGIGTLYDDDTPGPSNLNNTTAGYSRVDSDCWGYAEAHELMHNLGAVQSSASHSTPNSHCRDDYDQMCYDDGAGPPAIVCPNPDDELLFDCNNDDYFHTDPPAGSYLRTRWNTADSRWLTGGPPPPPGPANDAFASAAEMPSGGGPAAGTNSGATKQRGEPNHAANRGGASVWWTWTAPRGGRYRINTFGSSFDTLLGVYRGLSVSTLTRLASNDDDAGGFQSQVVLTLTRGQRLRIAVDGYNGAQGTIRLRIAPA